MKVLFAVSNEEISESIVKKYQKEYKQIISYKNVYYFNAILKELQKDKTYDRVVISEDLEAFTHTQYDQIDKFIFDKLDSISDEATNMKGNDIPIIVICSDRRTVSEEMLVKLFGIGVYNAILGNDRSVDEVCRLINRPRAKKDAKIYYKIDVDNVNYQSENENDVSEIEIQNILAHYKRLGKNEERYVESFDNIAAQYNDTQLRIISKFLPLNVRAVLEEKSPKYQKVMSFNNTVSNSLRKDQKEELEGTTEKLLKIKENERIMSRPVVIPTAVNMNSTKKLTKKVNKPVEQLEEINDFEDFKEIDDLNGFDEVENFEDVKPVEEKNPIDLLDEFENDIEEEINVVEEKTVKRGRGRPRKNATPIATTENVVKRGRGRPRKNVVQEIQEFDEEEFSPILPMGLEDVDEVEKVEELEEILLPGLDEEPKEIEESFESILPGIDYQEENFEDEKLEDYKEESNIQEFNKSYQSQNIVNDNQEFNSTYEPQYIKKEEYKEVHEVEDIDLSNLITGDKKIVTFVGTSKNGTSFIVNNLAELISSTGVNVAILDTTQNRNSYYIYTKNEEALRNIASTSIYNLVNGVAEGISVNKNLTVYTSLPNEAESVENAGKILQTLLKKHSLILIDTDFKTPVQYFKESQETYLVQTADVLTIQPLTAFLRELKVRNVLDEKKLKIILNKNVKIRGITDKTIIGGMAYYNEPAMSYMTELFDRNSIKYVSIPFEEEVYIKYLESMIECNITLKGYSKTFMQSLKELANMVYVSSNNAYRPPSAGQYGERNAFSPSINNTLNQMKRNY